MHEKSVGRLSSAAGVSYPRKGKVDLNLPPRERWAGLMTAHREEILGHFKAWQTVLSHHPEIVVKDWVEVIPRRLMSPEYLGELEGIFEALGGEAEPRVTWGMLLAFQAMYEIGSPMGCSELLAAAPDGTVLHGRNLDYKVVSPVFEVEYLRDNQVAYVSTVYLGHVGLHTALKAGFFSFGQNTRRVNVGDNTASALERLRGDGRLFGDFVRSLVDRDDVHYSQAVDELRNVHLLRDMYFIIGGPGAYEGTVLTRAADPRYRHEDTLSSKRWYLFQFNTDMHTFTIDPRPMLGQVAMSMTRQEQVNPETVLGIMRRFIIYTPLNVVLFMMAPRSGAHCSVLGPFVFHDDRSVDHKVCALSGWDSLSYR